jgi:hypothetical protein
MILNDNAQSLDAVYSSTYALAGVLFVSIKLYAKRLAPGNAAQACRAARVPGLE